MPTPVSAPLDTSSSSTPAGSTSLTMLKGLTVLELVASRSGPFAVGDVAQVLDMDKSTASRLLASLRTAGYLRQDRDRRYRLTSKLLFLTRNFIPAEHVRGVARDAASELHRVFDEAVHVASVEAGEIVFVDYLESSLAVQIRLPTVPAPLHLTAIGHAALASMPTDQRADALRLSAEAAGTTLETVDTEELRASITVTAERGYAIYTADDVIRIGAAIRGETGQSTGGISVSGPAYRMQGRIEEVGQRLVAATAGVRA